MKKILSIAIIFIAVPCFANTDTAVSSARVAVTKKLESRYKPDECEKWKLMASGGAIAQESAIAKCDNDFNPVYGLVFSSLDVKGDAGEESVCGDVSGRTDISRIGARFVYEVKTGNVTIKPSKYPLASLASSGELGKNQIKIENKQYELVYKAKCE
ncbi:hypothetical protein DVH07_06610 [Hafnia paralvei]|uniref:hypothetical protein n=1 Tax=Hafnia paralvei TaxID=546367 RepID=UPI000DF40AF7|nr:hypothetical protein [Hafnia paralvei]RDA68365.1 hypothetical protein DU449_07915 [Hafnia paralvei]RDA69404.1 hypothetical protein DVH09_08510 [Hafnia paralvei]RDA69565.1 hypothetical protein DVH08_09505 [Hafnia paralvei]RDA79608.1 hypothetical protein DVH10_06895 [Hafnia paralvei]RDA80146.1 hypothetical protein DVH07_06610 [Hafnia paralvei]